VKTVVALTSKEDILEAASCGADLIELRIDLFDISPEDIAAVNTPLPPLIVTLRSREEGGRFDGTPEEWLAVVRQWCGTADWIDIERKFSKYSRNLTKLGSCGIISSAHLPDTPGPEDLAALVTELRDYGDVPKIIVTPHSHRDVLSLLTFTLDAPKPVCTGAMGDGFRYARALAALVGSEFVYCHFGTPTAPGQYHIDTMKKLLEDLS